MRKNNLVASRKKIIENKKKLPSWGLNPGQFGGIPIHSASLHNRAKKSPFKN